VADHRSAGAGACVRGEDGGMDAWPGRSSRQAAPSRDAGGASSSVRRGLGPWA
jgi:hypothetical protein